MKLTDSGKTIPNEKIARRRTDGDTPSQDSGLCHHAYFEAIAAELKRLAEMGFLTRDSVTSPEWMRERWLHATVCGALTRAVPSHLIPMVEPAQGLSEGHFKPDLVIIDRHQRKQAVVEYESSNSSDNRLVVKDLRHYVNAIRSYYGPERQQDEPGWQLPTLWLIISTLPGCPVKGWPWYKYNALPCSKDRAQRIKDRNKNPLAYYEMRLHKRLDKRWKELSRDPDIALPREFELIWANIDQQNFRIMNLNGRPLGNGESCQEWQLF